MADTGEVRLDRYDFDSKYLDLPEGRVHYLDEGAGPVLLLLHGNPTWSYLYRHMILGLRDRFRCVAPDYLGFGLSDKPADGDYTVAGHTRRLGQLIERLGLEQVSPVMQDWGGAIGLGWAVAHRDRVARLIVMNTFPLRLRLRYFGPRQVFTIAGLKFASLPGLGELLLRRLNLFVDLVMPMAIHNRAAKTREIMRGYRFPLPDYDSRAATLQFPREIPISGGHYNKPLMADIAEKIEGWEVRTLIVWGARDPAFSLRVADYYAGLLPNHAPIVRIADAAHYLQEDAPEPIIAAIRGFFD